MMKMPEYDKCCFCIELRSGCLIIGYLQLIGELIILILGLVALAFGGALTAIHVENIKGHSAEETEEINEGIHLIAVVMLVLVGILLFLVFIAIGFTITLLIGLHTNKRGHIKAYLIYATILYVIAVLYYFASFANEHINVGAVMSNLFGLLLNLYFILVIRSHYVKLGEYSGTAVYTA